MMVRPGEAPKLPEGRPAGAAEFQPPVVRRMAARVHLAGFVAAHAEVVPWLKRLARHVVVKQRAHERVLELL